MSKTPRVVSTFRTGLSPRFWVWLTFSSDFVLVHKFGATCRSLIRNGISHPRFYGNIVYKSYKFKNRILDMSDSLNKFIHKGYKYDIIINTLRLVFRKKDIKLLIPLLNKN